MAIMTATQAAAYLPMLEGAGEDTLLDTLIARFDALAAARLSFPAAPGGAANAARTLEDSTYTIYVDGPDPRDARVLRLGVYPVVSVTSVHADAVRDYGADTLVDASDYTLFGAEGVVELASSASSAWHTGARANRAIIIAGWTSLPADIQHACGLQVAHWWRNRATLGVRNMSQRGTSQGLRSLALLPSVEQALEPHQLVGGAIV